MTSRPLGRQGHAVLDLSSRNLKAMKIAKLLDLSPIGTRGRLLEIGCGSGGISHWFGARGPMGWDVEAVDVEDVRLVRDGYSFSLVTGTDLPFEDASFDVVLTNHVIEHVGDEDAQHAHLREIRRVLRPGGMAYLAVPCRWMLVEPHYRLPFLSWLSQPLADAYVRIAGKGAYYDCRPLTTRQLESALRTAGFTCTQKHGEALRLTYELERPDALLYRFVFKPIPERIYALLRSVFPTLIYTLTPHPSDSSASICRATSVQDGSVP